MLEARSGGRKKKHTEKRKSKWLEPAGVVRYLKAFTIVAEGAKG